MSELQMTPKQWRAYQGYMATGTLLGAASYVGKYKNKNSAEAAAHRLLHEPAVQSAMAKALREAGLDEDFVAKNLKKLAEATKTLFFHYKGKITQKIVVPDNHIRLQALKLAGKWLGLENHPDTLVYVFIVEPDDSYDYANMTDAELYEALIEAEKSEEQRLLTT